jgi:hypothetical protein
VWEFQETLLELNHDTTLTKPPGDLSGVQKQVKTMTTVDESRGNMKIDVDKCVTFGLLSQNKKRRDPRVKNVTLKL